MKIAILHSAVWEKWFSFFIHRICLPGKERDAAGFRFRRIWGLSGFCRFIFAGLVCLAFDVRLDEITAVSPLRGHDETVAASVEVTIFPWRKMQKCNRRFLRCAAE
ncbi:hypothetical protein [Tunturiibacter gelidiferens]|uniref:hypothetical protein n=1 Tax=Tunturiibacter gelidiferens TaxID=3069689 RepID=UPI003D9B159A